jgi:DNA polymerase III delta subunit
VGNDPGSLMSELRKIDLDLAPGKKIDRAAIEDSCGVSRTAGPEDLARALARKDLGSAMELIDNLFSSNAGAPFIIAGLFRHFWALFRIRAWAEAHREEAAVFVKGQPRDAANEVALRIGIAAGLLTEQQANRVFPVVIKSGIVSQARTFKTQHLRQILGWLCAFDLDTKTGRINPDICAVQTLCYRIARVGELSGGAAS